MSTLTEKAVDLIAYLDKNAKPEPRPNAPPTIAELLTQSRASHQVYRRALKHRANGVVVEGDPIAAAEALTKSARLRALAEIHDPRHADSAWADDLAAKSPHAALIEFYDSEAKFLMPPVADVKSPEPEPDPKPVEDVIEAQK